MKVSMGFLTRATTLPLAFVLCGPMGLAQDAAGLPQAPVPNLVATKLPGGVVVERATPGALPLSLDEAIDRGLKKNLQILLSQQNERYVHGQVLTVKNSLLPSMTAVAKTSAQEINLEALVSKGRRLEALG